MGSVRSRAPVLAGAAVLALVVGSLLLALGGDSAPRLTPPPPADPEPASGADNGGSSPVPARVEEPPAAAPEDLEPSPPAPGEDGPPGPSASELGIAGRIEDDLGAPLPGVTVLAWREENDWGRFPADAKAETDADGGFTLPPPPEAGWWISLYTVQPDLIGGGRLKRIFSGSEGTRIRLARGGWVSCRLVLLARLRDGPVRFQVRDSNGRVQSCDVGWSGTAPDRIRLGPYAPGPVDLRVRAPGLRPAGPVHVTIVPGEEADAGAIPLEAGGTLRVRVVGPDGEAPGNVTIVLAMADPDPGPVWWEVGQLTAVPVGQMDWEASGLPEGRVVLRVLPERYPPEIRSGIEAGPGRAVQADVLLAPAAVAVLRCTDADGRAVRGLHVLLRDDDDFWGPEGRFVAGERTFSRPTTRTDAEGGIRLPGRRRGRWPVWGWHRAERVWRRLGDVDLREGENPEVALRWPGAK